MLWMKKAYHVPNKTPVPSIDIHCVVLFQLVYSLKTKCKGFPFATSSLVKIFQQISENALKSHINFFFRPIRLKYLPVTKLK